MKTQNKSWSYDEKIQLARTAKPGMRWACRRTGKVAVVVAQAEAGMVRMQNEATGRSSVKQHHFLASNCQPVD